MTVGKVHFFRFPKCEVRFRQLPSFKYIVIGRLYRKQGPAFRSHLHLSSALKCVPGRSFKGNERQRAKVALWRVPVPAVFVDAPDVSRGT